jgi:hypothetical protein
VWYHFCIMRIVVVLFIFAIATLCAQDKIAVAHGSKVFITPMEKNLDAFLMAELQKQKVPVEIVLKQEDAQYVVTGFSQMTGTHWAEQVAATIFGGKDKYEASVKMVTADGKTLVWSGEAGDRSLFLGGLRRGGQRKVAQRIVKDLKSQMFP